MTRRRSQRAQVRRSTEAASGHRLHELLGQPLQLLSMYLRIGQKLGLQERWLTTPGDDSHASLMLTHGVPGAKSRLVVAGIHGDEPAGVVGLLAFLFTLFQRPTLLRQAGSFALVPLLSPSAFELQTRNNLWDEDANRGFSMEGISLPESEQPGPSREGLSLSENLDALAEWARVAVLALHEDRDQNNFYLYAFNGGEEPGPLARRLRDVGGGLFGLVPDSDAFEGSRIRGGVIFNHFVHGAFDEVIYERLGVPVIVTETPGLLSLDARAEASLRLLEAFFLGR